MSALLDLLPLWVALGGAGIVWWAQGEMRQADDELSAFTRPADLHQGP